MRNKTLLIGAMALTALAADAGLAERPGLLARWREARAAQQRTNVDATVHDLSIAGQQRRYRLLDAHRGSAPAPLIVALHGGGGNGASMIARWADQARRAGVIVVAPDGIGRNDRMGTWNAGGCCGEAASRGVDDIAFVAAVIDDVARRTAVDPRRIYITGFSNGGMLTHRVAIALGNRIAAAAVVSGAMFGDEPRAVAPVPMLVIHGEHDDVVPFAGGNSPKGFVGRMQSRPFLATRRSVDAWRTTNGCTAAPVVTHSAGASVETSTGCTSGAAVRFVDRPLGEHEWPDARGADGAFDASATIWQFFAAQRR